MKLSHGALFIFISILSSCALQRVRVDRLPSLALNLTTTYAPRSEYATAFYRALCGVLRDRGVPTATADRARYILSTSCTPARMSDALTSERGVAHATAIEATITAQLHDQQGAQVWQHAFTQRDVAHRPGKQAWYPHFFAHARDELCYASALHLYTALLGFLAKQ